MDVAPYLRSYILKRQRPDVGYEAFMAFLRKDPQFTKIDEFKVDLTVYLKRMESQGKCTISYEKGAISSFLMHDYYEEIIKLKYAEIKEDPTLPFPNEETLGFAVPQSIFVPADVTTDFISLLDPENTPAAPLIRLNFPHTIQSLFAPPHVLRSGMAELCIQKLRQYLQTQRNMDYAHSNLLPALKGNESSLKDMLRDLTIYPDRVLKDLLNPGDFTFKFWAFFPTLIMNEYKEKKERLLPEHGYCQSAILLRYYSQYQRSLVQKENQRANDIKVMEQLVKKPPYLFSLDDFYALKDSKGNQYSKKYGREFVHEFIETRLREEDKTKLPPLVRLKPQGKREVYISRDFIVPMFLSELHKVSDKLRAVFMDEWTATARTYAACKAMQDDGEFAKEIEQKIEAGYPLFSVLRNKNLLYVAKETTKLSQNNVTEINRCFTGKMELRPIQELLGLSRKELAKNVKARLPFWYTTPVFKQIAAFFAKMLSGSGKKNREKRIEETHKTLQSNFVKEVNAPKSGEIGAGKPKAPKDAAAEYRKAVETLKKQFLGEGKSIDASLEELAEKWNPLYDPNAKANLVEDVNSLIRDFMRSIKRTFAVRPPDAERIGTLAEELTLKTLKELKISKREYFKKYIELYMIRLLEKAAVSKQNR